MSEAKVCATCKYGDISIAKYPCNGCVVGDNRWTPKETPKHKLTTLNYEIKLDDTEFKQSLKDIEDTLDRIIEKRKQIDEFDAAMGKINNITQIVLRELAEKIRKEVYTHGIKL